MPDTPDFSPEGPAGDVSERQPTCPESCGWDNDLFRANLDAGAFDGDVLIEQWGVAHLARHILAATDDALAAEQAAHAETRREIEHVKLWGFSDGYHWYEDLIEWLGDWHDEEMCDGPRDLVAEVKAKLATTETALEAANREVERLREVLEAIEALDPYGDWVVKAQAIAYDALATPPPTTEGATDV